MQKVLILGLGNILLNDEGIGVHVVNRMKKMTLPEKVDILDGGTGGFTLLSLFSKYDTIIIVDATIGNNNSEDIKVIKPKFSKDFPPSLSSHSLGLKDMIESTILLGTLPQIFLVAVPVNNNQDMKMKLTAKTEKKIPEIIQRIKNILRQR